MCVVCELSGVERGDETGRPHVWTDLDDLSGGEVTFTGSGIDASIIYADVPADTSTSAVLTIGSSYNGEIETEGDVDWIKVTLTAGTTYNFSAEGRFNWGDWTLADPELQLVDASGNVLASDSDSGWVYDAQFFYTAAASGDFYLVVNAGSQSPTTGTYEIESEIIGADQGVTAATAGTLTVGGSVRGAIETIGDADWFEVSLEAGKEYFFSTTTITSSDLNTLEATRVNIYDASGNLVASSSDSILNYDSVIKYIADASSSYFVEVVGRDRLNDDNSEIGTYSLSVDEVNLFSNDQIATQLTNGYWGGSQRAWDLSGGRQITVDITALDALGQATARYALQSWTDVLGIQFLEVASGAQLTFDDEVIGSAYASSSVSNGVITSSFINVGKGWSSVTEFGLNNYLTQTYIHEIGHSLGLGHGGNYNGAASYGTDNLYANDSWQATVMSYFSQNENSYIDASYAFVATPQITDILAVRNLYGFAGETRTGDTIYGAGNNTGNDLFGDGLSNVSFTIVDDGGIDTLAAGAFGAATISLVEETFSSLNGESNNVAIARGTVIENATGSTQSDTLVGNAADNVLTGLAGDDTFRGNGGIDTIKGGDGTDVVQLTGNLFADYMVASVGVGAFIILDMNLADGDDGLIVTDSVENWSIGATVSAIFENALLNSVDGDVSANLMSGTAARDVLAGFDGADSLFGYGDNDILHGGLGNDSLYGGDGVDVLLGGAGNDTLSDAGEGQAMGDAGNDWFYWTLNSLGETILSGGDGDDTFTVAGSLFANGAIHGGTGSDRIDVSGGLDLRSGTMTGIELLDMNDTQTVTATLAQFNAFSSILEAGVLTVASGSGTLDLTQLTLASDAGAVTIQSASGVTVDVSHSTARWSLLGGDGIDLLLAGSGDDVLNGGAGNDILFHSAGADFFVGGTGLDYVSYSNAAAVMIDLTVHANNAGDALGDGYTEVEAFFLSGFNDTLQGSAANEFIFSGGGNDVIRGNGGGDILFGEGGDDFIESGALSDIVVGGSGADTFYYSLNQVEQDQILDFVSGTDRFEFASSGFNIAAGALTTGVNFISTTSAAGASYAAGTGVLIYFTDLGLLYADTDGAGGNAANLIAALGANTTLIASDISVVAAPSQQAPLEKTETAILVSQPLINEFDDLNAPFGVLEADAIHAADLWYQADMLSDMVSGLPMPGASVGSELPGSEDGLALSSLPPDGLDDAVKSDDAVLIYRPLSDGLEDLGTLDGPLSRTLLDGTPHQEVMMDYRLAQPVMDGLDAFAIFIDDGAMM